MCAYFSHSVLFCVLLKNSYIDPADVVSYPMLKLIEAELRNGSE